MSKKDGLYNLTLGEKKLELKGDWKCISHIEDSFGKGILSFYTKDLVEMNLTVSQIATVFHAGLRSIGDTRLNHDDICKLVVGDGLMTHLKNCMEFVSMMLSGSSLEEADSSKK